jgi:type 1 glutamine amidotransferase
MLGAQFLRHGKPFKGILKVVDPDHPTMAHIPDRWETMEEWYLFRHFDRQNLHVLALLEIGDERGKQELYRIPDSPMIWCRQYGAGRVYYNALGHFEERWESDKIHLESVKDAIRWVAGSDTKPNWDATVPENVP